MEEFKKPEHLIIDAIPYLTEIMGDGLVKDLQEDEIICPICHGTGLAADNNRYGLSNDPNKTEHFPYKHQSISSCQNCYNGVLKVCPHCGKVLTRRDYQCNCDGVKAEKRNKEIAKEKEVFDKSIKLNYDDEKAKAMGMLYSEDYGYNEGYFSEWDEFFDYWWDNHDDNENKPTYVWGTTQEEIKVDADSIIESATDDLWEGARDNISDSDEKELQDYLNNWCAKQVGTTTYYESYKYSVLIPWDKYNR